MSSGFMGHPAMEGRLCIRGRAMRSSVVSTSHIFERVGPNSSAIIASPFGSFADVPFCYVLLTNISISVCFTNSWIRLDRYKSEYTLSLLLADKVLLKYSIYLHPSPAFQ
jgi:hypothetical protein